MRHATWIFSAGLALLLPSPALLGQTHELEWSDEFSDDGLPDPAKWTYDTQEPGELNGELQKYVPGRRENSRIEGGELVIEARKDGYSGYAYTSARLVSRGKHSFRYGMVEIRAKLPWGRGTWPGLFMLSQDWLYGEWPKSGEIDIMEHVGFNMNWVRSSIHCDKYNFHKFWHEGIGEEKNADVYVPGVAEGYHRYRLAWTPERIAISVDDEPAHFIYDNEHEGWTSWPFDQGFYLIMNLAVGGEWGGQQGVDEAIFPQAMRVDYVRIYRAKDSAPSPDGIWIEAEDYREARGIQTEPCSEGGRNIGWIDPGDWAKYRVRIPAAGLYEVRYRVASPEGVGEIALDQDGHPLGFIAVPRTSGWQSWRTIQHQIRLEAGEQNLALYANAGGFNVNWIQIVRARSGTN